MGENMPGYNPDALTWLEGRIATWQADPAGIGLTSALVTTLATDVTTSRNAFTSVQTVRGESKNATEAFKVSGDGMRASASLLIATIKAFADASSDPQLVYDAANVSPQDPRSPAPPPEQPANLEAVLQNNGTIELSWSGRGPTGTLYEVYRRLPTETTFDLLGNVDALTKSYNDAAIPAGTTFLTYQVRAVRGDQVSPFSTQFSIQFGSIDAAAEMGMAA